MLMKKDRSRRSGRRADGRSRWCTKSRCHPRMRRTRLHGRDPDARQRALDTARLHPPPGISPDAAVPEVWEVLDSPATPAQSVRQTKPDGNLTMTTLLAWLRPSVPLVALGSHDVPG
jgi:hypothetical protein